MLTWETYINIHILLILICWELNYSYNLGIKESFMKNYTDNKMQIHLYSVHYKYSVKWVVAPHCVFSCTVPTGNKLQLDNFSIARLGTRLILVNGQFFTLECNYRIKQKYRMYYLVEIFITTWYPSRRSECLNHNKSLDTTNVVFLFLWSTKLVYQLQRVAANYMKCRRNNWVKDITIHPLKLE